MKTKNLFIGFKSSRAIPVRNGLTRDFLVQSTLDGGVCRIDYQPVPRAESSIVPRGTIILERSDGRFAIDIVLDGGPACGQAAELLEVAFARQCSGIMVVDANDIMAEPRLSSAREVWNYRNMRIHADDRAEIVGALENEGPTTLARLGEIAMTRSDTRAAIYAMACDGTIELDLRCGLGPDGLVLPGRFGGSTTLLTAFGA
ncbi:hypothetical protein [Bradyrhizobium sp. Ash2021]|uniref:hypothetical protein n=1 Tax=Bradyrhizobium sp. Ash2021 TaxID=2954771 RepID=UPI002815035A|nr:hypothetical protein [Bradyrhizobium sp. Ash2021]WMT76285.1 hypothetical protein NL528_07905 [Bradyrhizobium sp. Ash2021]